MGILGGGGDPGFALPAPIIPAFIFTDKSYRFYNAILPFLFWWTLLFAFQLVRRLYKTKFQLKKGEAQP